MSTSKKYASFTSEPICDKKVSAVFWCWQGICSRIPKRLLTVSVTHGENNDFISKTIQSMREKLNKVKASLPNFVDTKIDEPGDATLTDRTCRQNMTYTECGRCERTCLNREMACTLMCRPPGCYCNPGYFLNEQGNCVLESDCLNGDPDDIPLQSKSVMAGKTLRKDLTKYKFPTIPTKECKENETWDSCGNRCEGTCNMPHKSCFLVCGPGACVCNAGFLRNGGGVCVPQDDCPK
uniref:TIL domain-containing protein n=1 Tax=Strongyloides papillosus TaxID=174720 RepID=A0A0N5BU19_STREA